MSRMSGRCFLGVFLIASAVAAAHGDRMSALSRIHNPVLRQMLAKTEVRLASQLSRLQTRGEAFNAQCRQVPKDSPADQRCRAQDTALEGKVVRYRARMKLMIRDFKRALYLPPSATALWSVRGHVILMRGLVPVRADDQILENGDCVRTFAGANAMIVVPQGAFSMNPKSHFCYQPEKEAGVIGVLGYLYHWQTGHEVRATVTVVGVRG